MTGVINKREYFFRVYKNIYANNYSITKWACLLLVFL